MIYTMENFKDLEGQSIRGILNYDWPTPDGRESYFAAPGAALRGSIRLCDNRIVGSEEVQKEWEENVAEAQEMLLVEE